ncbi:MAG: NADH-quinone oxidoreductase subunit NuoK [Vulcanimicrobiota bacterium]
MTDGSITLGLSAALFAIGAMGVAIRRNPLIMFMCIELMLNSANLALATFSRYYSRIPETLPDSIELAASNELGSSSDGSIFVFLVMTIAAAEAVVGLAIIIAIFRTRKQVDADELAELKG